MQSLKFSDKLVIPKRSHKFPIFQLLAARRRIRIMNVRKNRMCH